MRAFVAGFVLFASVPAPAAEIDPNCLGLFVQLVDGRRLPAWSFDSSASISAYGVASFLPDDYLASLQAAGYRTKIEIRERNLRYDIKISAARGSETRNIARFDLWPGRGPKSVILEHLSLEDPLASNVSLGAGQTNKGLPIRVGIEFRNRLYGFLAAGGYRELEVGTPQNFLVGTLYRRMLGGEQSPVAKEFGRYLDQLYSVVSKLPEPYRVADLNAYSAVIGDYFLVNPVVRRAEEVLGKHGFTFTPELEKKIADLGGEILQGPDGARIGIGVAGKLVLLYPDGSGFRVLNWQSVVRNQPSKIKVIVRLPERNL